MNFQTANHTDIGIRKKTNQDSLLIEQAQTDNYGTVLLAVVCDGMGGLAKGEVASATMIRRFSAWFNTELPAMLQRGFNPDELRNSWEKMAVQTSNKILAYGDACGISLGTTCVCLLIISNCFYIMNVGDSRVYLLSDGIYQRTKDQSYCQREIDLGRMTPEQAAVDPQRSVLLQCIGAGEVVDPDFFAGTVNPGECYLLCSDGFAHVISPQEIYDNLNPAVSVNSAIMKQNLVKLIELDKQRGETDNITALLIRTY